MNRTLRILFILTNILAVIFLLLSHYSPQIDPTEEWRFSFFGLVFPVLIILNLLYAVLWLIVRPLFSFLSIIAIVFCYSSLEHLFQFNFFSDDEEEPLLHILTYNVHNGFRMEGELSDELVDLFSKQDIICLQEYRANNIAANESLKRKFPHRYTYLGTSIWSSIPLQNTGYFNFEATSNSCIYADVEVHGRKLRIYNNHLQSNKISTETGELVEDPDLREKNTWLRIRHILRSYKYFTIQRVEQSRKILAHVEKSPYPAIICGDFNDTPQSYVYNLFESRFRDSFNEEGSGFGITYSGVIPFLRIDYFFVSAKLDVVNHFVLDVEGSDHYPVQCIINI